MRFGSGRNASVVFPKFLDPRLTDKDVGRGPEVRPTSVWIQALRPVRRVFRALWETLAFRSDEVGQWIAERWRGSPLAGLGPGQLFKHGVHIKRQIKLLQILEILAAKPMSW